MKLFFTFAATAEPEMSLTERASVWWEKSNFKSGIKVQSVRMAKLVSRRLEGPGKLQKQAACQLAGYAV